MSRDTTDAWIGLVQRAGEWEWSWDDFELDRVRDALIFIAC